jgi:hypothetical protein|eukprot:scaffold3198_cov213-Alexandrium_tamarense.AAC.8
MVGVGLDVPHGLGFGGDVGGWDATVFGDGGDGDGGGVGAVEVDACLFFGGLGGGDGFKVLDGGGRFDEGGEVHGGLGCVGSFHAVDGCHDYDSCWFLCVEMLKDGGCQLDGLVNCERLLCAKALCLPKSLPEPLFTPSTPLLIVIFILQLGSSGKRCWCCRKRVENRDVVERAILLLPESGSADDVAFQFWMLGGNTIRFAGSLLEPSKMF